MRKKYILLLMMLFVLLMTFSACGKDDDKKNPNPDRVNIEKTNLLSLVAQDYTLAFFPLEDGKTYVARSFPINSTREVARLSVEKLLVGSPDDFCGNVIPEGVKFVNLSLDEGVLELDLSCDEGQEVAAEQVDFQAFALSLNFAVNEGSLSFTEPYPLNILLNNIPLLEEPFVMDTCNPSTGKTLSGETYTVFFGDSQAQFIIPVSFSLEKDLPREDMYKKVTETWMTGSVKLDSVSAMNLKKVKLNDVTFQGGLLSLDFSKELVSYGGGTAYETILVDSLIWNFSPYEEVKSVQLLIDGEILEYLPEGIDVSKPIAVPHNYKLLNKI